MTSKKLTPVQSIKSYCRYFCANNDLDNWKNCSVETCVLWGYRLGHRPKVKPFHEYTQKQVNLPINSTKNNKLQNTSTKEPDITLGSDIQNKLSPLKENGI